MSRRILYVLLAATLAACSEGGTEVSRTAPEQVLLRFDDAAIAANGDYPAAAPKTVCGADDRRFVGELVQDSPLNYKVPKRLADIKASPSAIMIAGTAASVSIGAGDFPFDHTFGSDFNMDVDLDPPFASAAQLRGEVEGQMHVELSAGQLPHEVGASGPAAGQEWNDMSARSRQGIFTRFVPEEGDRVLVLGSWVVDCGHTNFETELHPLTFMAHAHVADGKTRVDAFYNPYRETQLYHPDPAKALAFDDTARFTDPATKPFPGALIDSIIRIQDIAPEPYHSVDHLESWAMLEPNRASPVQWRVCAPVGSSGTRLDVRYQWIKRPGVEITVTPDDLASCATVSTVLGSSTIAPPPARSCVTPWPFLNEVAGAEGGIENLDLQAELGKFVAPQFKSRLDPSPTLNCYDPLAGPPLESDPTGQRIEDNDTILLPFYGTITVTRAG